MLETRLPRLLLWALLFAYVTEAIIKYPPLMTKQPPSEGELLFQVATGKDEYDKPFIIECEANGEPAPKYRWHKNGKEFKWQIYDERISQQPGRGTLVITSPRVEDAGHYQCFAENELGIATSNSVFVRQSVLDIFKNKEPRTMVVTEGDPARLSCQHPYGYPKPTVYWLIQDDSGALRSINSTRRTVDPEGTLWFSKVTREDRSNDFKYVCSATSTFRNEYKVGSKVYLKVNDMGSSAGQQIEHEPTKQFVSRKNTVILKGKKLTLWCIISGTPLPQIKWSKKGSHLPIDRIEYSNYGKTLNIMNIDSSDNGTYQCEASNGIGTTKSYTMNVVVHAIPYFTKEPHVQNKGEGETGIFECMAKGIPEPIINWIHNGRPIQQTPNYDLKIRPNKLIITNLTFADIGNYGCNATNQHGYVYRDVYVNVLALPPDIRVEPTDVRTVKGRNVNMTCRVFGAPTTRVSWIRDGQELTGGRYNITNEGDLIIMNVSFTDRGMYVCDAMNKFGSQKKSGSLEVFHRTKITDAPLDYEVPAGSTATFRCNAVADPSLELDIDWMINGKMIDFSQEPRFVNKFDNSLSITKTTELDSGNYTCIASTELDQTSKFATLIVQDVPNAPRLTGIVCHDKDASVTWQPTGDNHAPILGYTIQHNTSFTPDTWENSFENFPASSKQYTAEMSPWANYTFRVIARNKIGPSLPSEKSKMCSTLGNFPYKNPDGVQGKGTTANNLVIKWSPMPEIEHNGHGFYYRVYWKRDDVADARWDTAKVTDWERDQYIVASQSTFKPYRLKVEAHNELGEAQVAASEIIGYSGEDIPREAPTNFKHGPIDHPTTVELNWQPVSEDSIRGHFKGYKIQTWTEGQDASKARDIIVENNNEPSAVIGSFVPNIKNFARVLVFNGAYDGPTSEIIELDMPEGPPGPVDNLVAIPLGSSGFLLVWKKTKKPNGILTGYHIYYQEVQGTNTGSTSERQPAITDPSTTRAKLANLKPDTKYRITIKARTNAGIGNPFFIERRTSDGNSNPPGKPSFIWQHINTLGREPALKITWIPNVSNAGSHFFVQYKRYGESIFDSKLELSEDFLILEGLEPSNTYEVRIVSVDGDFNTKSDIEEIDTYASGLEDENNNRSEKPSIIGLPNPPLVTGTMCVRNLVSITWNSNAGFRGPILEYTIQYKTSFTSDTWQNLFQNYPGCSTQYTVQRELSPWANYTFRVIARNSIGDSLPSKPSLVCRTNYDVPYKNPEGVQGKGTTDNNLVIKWLPMPEIEHNGPGFKYKVFWKRYDIDGDRWQTDQVFDWQRRHYEIRNLPTLKPYKIKVEAHNQLGEARIMAHEVIGFSGI